MKKKEGGKERMGKMKKVMAGSEGSEGS
jgi:hypothetical protein